MKIFVVCLVACVVLAAARPQTTPKAPAQVKEEQPKDHSKESASVHAVHTSQGAQHDHGSHEVHPAGKQAKYTTKYDNVNLDEILKSDRLLQNYVNCALEKAPCSPDGAELKKSIPEALKDGCAKCSPKQKEGSKKVIEHLIKHKPEMWKPLQAKYDPKGEYTKKYEAELKKAKV